MKNHNRTIVIVLAALFLITCAGVIVNRQYAQQKAALAETAEIAVLANGQEVCRLTMANLSKLPVKDFTAALKSSVMKRPEEHTYSGVAFSQLFTLAGISLEGKKRVVVHSVDGYAVPLTIDEIKQLENVYLVFKDNGDYLGKYNQKGGQGPYMIVIKGDRFSQRWAKYVCELDVQ
jgi:hypothetical protein